MSARMGAFTGDPQWEDRYDKNSLLLDKAILELQALTPPGVSNNFIKKTDIANQQLIEIEKNAFYLAKHKKTRQSQSLLLSETYQKYKLEYAAGLTELNEEVSKYKKNILDSAYTTIEGTKKNSIICIIAILVVWTFTYSKLTRWKKDIENLNLTLEDKVKERTKQLEREKEYSIRAIKLASLGEMAASIAHEINNPLTIILMKAESIQTGLETPQINHLNLKKTIESLIGTTHRISKIVNNIKSFAQMGHSDPYEKHNLSEMIQESTKLLETKFTKHQIDFQCADLAQVYFECKSTQIIQVLTNLISNSIDAIEKMPSPWIRISVEVKDHLYIQVTDSGLGIKAEHQEHLFEPLFTTKTSGKGTGLGLMISKRIIESHNGALYLKDNEPNTCFEIRIPFEQPYTHLSAA